MITYRNQMLRLFAICAMVGAAVMALTMILTTPTEMVRGDGGTTNDVPIPLVEWVVFGIDGLIFAVALVAYILLRRRKD